MNSTDLDLRTNSVLELECNEPRQPSTVCQDDTGKNGFHWILIERDMLMDAQRTYGFDIDDDIRHLDWDGCILAQFIMNNGQVKKLREQFGSEEEYWNWFLDNDIVRDLVHERPWTNEERGDLIDKAYLINKIPTINCIDPGSTEPHPIPGVYDLWRIQRHSDLPDY